MNIFLNEYFGFYFELNIELNHFLARFNEKMNIQNVSARASVKPIPFNSTYSLFVFASQYSGSAHFKYLVFN